MHGLRWLALLALGVSLIGFVPPAQAITPAREAACNTLLTLRGWRPPMILAGHVPEPRAVALLRDHLRWQRNAITATRLAPDVDDVKDALWQAVRDFNLRGLYRTLPEARGDWRSLTLKGQLEPSVHRVSGTESAAFDGPLPELGETASQLAMRPRTTPADGPRGARYALRARMRANIGPIEWANVLKAAWTGLDHLTTTAPLPVPGGSGFFAGTGSDAEILLQLQPAFENFFRWYLSISEIPDILATDSARSAAQHLHLIVRADNGLQERYPEVADYLAQIKGFISANVTIENEAGRWLEVDLDSVEKRLTIDAWVHHGHLVPSRDGVPMLDAVDPETSLDQLSYRSIADIKLKALGVTVHLDQWPIDWRYRRSGDGADYEGRITQKPTVRVGGAAFGFIPTGVVDVAIPNNIEGIVDDFMQVLTQSNEGEGARLRVAFDDSDEDSLLAASAEGDTLDNFFVRFAVSLVNERIIPDAAQFQGLKQLAGDGLAALTEDTNGLSAAQQRVRDSSLSNVVEQCRGQ